jgi:hypothetical protein
LLKEGSITICLCRNILKSRRPTISKTICDCMIIEVIRSFTEIYWKSPCRQNLSLLLPDYIVLILFIVLLEVPSTTFWFLWF